jgi:hypothetical protein
VAPMNNHSALSVGSAGKRIGSHSDSTPYGRCVSFYSPRMSHITIRCAQRRCRLTRARMTATSSRWAPSHWSIMALLRLHLRPRAPTISPTTPRATAPRQHSRARSPVQVGVTHELRNTCRVRKGIHQQCAHLDVPPAARP